MVSSSMSEQFFIHCCTTLLWATCSIALQVLPIIVRFWDLANTINHRDAFFP
jgi:hypothetical protein